MTTAIDRAVANVDFGRAIARKRGRHPSYPYVPIIERPSPRYGTSTVQLVRVAFDTPESAVEYGERHLEALRDDLRRRLALPNMRALRAAHGLARELETLTARPCPVCEGTGYGQVDPPEDAGLGYTKPRTGSGECETCEGGGWVRQANAGAGRIVRAVADGESLDPVLEAVPAPAAVA